MKETLWKAERHLNKMLKPGPGVRTQWAEPLLAMPASQMACPGCTMPIQLPVTGTGNSSGSWPESLDSRKYSWVGRPGRSTLLLTFVFPDLIVVAIWWANQPVDEDLSVSLPLSLYQIDGLFKKELKHNL